MESAIALHLQCPRSRPRAVADDHVPPYPAWTSRPDPNATHVVMGIWGVQWQGQAGHAVALAEFQTIDTLMGGPNGPAHRDRARLVDADGWDTLILVAYWGDRATYDAWDTAVDVAAWWESVHERAGIGVFREILIPPVARLETLLSGPDHPQGVGHVLSHVSTGDIMEHGYWGSMRDRLALAQTDALAPEGALAVLPAAAPGRVRVAGHRNLAMIRSGQDWSATAGEERALYTDRMGPILAQGMDYLRDSGRAIGCYVNRFAREVDADGQPLERTFGFAYWHSLADMERWAEDHPTHVAIFGTFMQMVTALGGTLALQLYHEVTVLDAGDQQYDYVNCHPRTGLLAATATASPPPRSPA